VHIFTNSFLLKKIKLYKALNQLLGKMIHCFERFEVAHAGEPCWSDQVFVLSPLLSIFRAGFVCSMDGSANLKWASEKI